MKQLVLWWQQWAYLPAPWGWPCRPWNLLWRLIIASRRRWLTAHPVLSLTIPVIVIGNLTVGGSGKTPVVMALAKALMTRGYRVGILTRGYQSSTKTPVLVDMNQTAQSVGDEAWLMAQQISAPVMVGANRPAAYQQLIEQKNLDVILSDDGLQHYALPRSLEVLVINAQKGWGNGCALPFGPLRELPNRVHAVDFVLSTHGAWPGACPVKQQLVPQVKHFKRAQYRSLSSFKGTPVHAVAGIGFPDIFFKALVEQGLTIMPCPLPDHAPLTLTQVQSWGDIPIVMTEKDAVKCQDWPAEYDIWVVSLDSQLPDQWVEDVITALEKKHAR